MSKIEFVGLGYCSNDYLSRVPAIPIDHKCEIIEHQIQGGGPAADAAVCASRLGLNTMFLTSVGSDEAGAKILADLRKENIDVSGIPVRRNCGSPISYCWIDAEGRRSVAWTKNGLELLHADEIPADVIAGAKLLHLDGHHPEAALAAAKIAKANNVLFNFDAGTIRPDVGELVVLADILIASEYFVHTYTGEAEIEKAVRKLGENPARVVGATCGEKGSYFLIDGKIRHFDAFKVPVIDTTGAGDSFHAAFAVRYLECGDVAESVRFGSAVAAIKCGKLGARAGLPTRAAVDEFLRQN